MMIDSFEIAADLVRDGEFTEKEAKAIAQAVAHAGRDEKLNDIDKRLSVLTWMVGTNIGLSLLVLGRLLFIR